MKKMNFEQAMGKIEGIVSYLESDQFELENALKRYEEGVKLIRYCQKKLSEFEKKVELLQKGAGSEVKKKDITTRFDFNDEE